MHITLCTSYLPACMQILVGTFLQSFCLSPTCVGSMFLANPKAGSVYSHFLLIIEVYTVFLVHFRVKY